MHPGGFGDVDAARFEIKHRFAFGIAHLYFRTGTGGKAHFQAARGVGGGEEAFRPRGVIAIGKHRFRTVYRNGFGIAGVAQHAQFQLGGFFQRTLGEDAGAANL